MELYRSDREEALSVSDRAVAERELIVRMRNLWRYGERRHWLALRSIIAEARSTPARLRDYARILPQAAHVDARAAREPAREAKYTADADIEVANTLIYSFNWYHLLTHQLNGGRSIDTCASSSAA